MEKNNKLALIVAYYLSKFDNEGLKELGYKSFKECFEDIGKMLGVKPSTIKNMREEFDPLHPNKRVGWYQRELRPSRVEVLDKYSELSKYALGAVVKDIIDNSQNHQINEEIAIYMSPIKDDEEIKANKKVYTTRGITGKKAEEIFKSEYNKGLVGTYNGKLQDKTSDGCGYDFEVVNDGVVYAFEVKGAARECNGIMFTDKEWEKANELRDRYILVIVSQIETNHPKINIFKNPANMFEPNKTIQTVVTVNWNVDSKQIKNVNDKINYKLKNNKKL